MKAKLRGGAEQDALTGWRHYLNWKPGVRKAIKKHFNRRQRRIAKKENQP